MDDIQKPWTPSHEVPVSDYQAMRDAFSVEELETIQNALFNRITCMNEVMSKTTTLAFIDGPIMDLASRERDKARHVLNILLAERSQRRLTGE
jgi:hypothetical protein